MQPVVDISTSNQKIGDEEIPRAVHFFPEQIRRAAFRSGQQLFVGRGGLTSSILHAELYNHARMLQIVFGDDEPILVPTEAGTVTFTDSKKAAVRAALTKNGRPPSFISSYGIDEVLKIAANFWTQKLPRTRKLSEEADFQALGNILARVAAVTVQGDMTRGDALNVARAILDESMPAAAPGEIARLRETNPFHASQNLVGIPVNRHRRFQPQLAEARVA